MPDQIEFVQLEPNEDATSVRDRLSFLRGQQVLIIWPEEGTALTRRLDLVLVQREAMRRAIRLALVTHDPDIIEQAKELNISTFETIGASQRGRWKRGRSKVFTSRDDQPDDSPDAQALMPVASRVRVAPRVSASRLVRWLVVLGVLAALGGLIWVVVPGATVTIDLAEEIIEIETEIIASPLITRTNIETGMIPARNPKVELEETGSRQTSGSQNLPSIPATGVITIINNGANPLDVPAGTIVSTSGGQPVRFNTTIAVTIPPGQGVEINIAAVPESSGDVGNVEAALINTVEAEWRDSVTVINLNPTTGGETRNLPSVTQEDRDRLLASVRQQLQARALSIFEAELGPNEILITETLSIAPEGERKDWKTFSAQVGDLTDTLTLRMRAIVQVVVIDRRGGEEIVFTRMGQRVPRGRLIEVGTVEYTQGPVINVDEQNQVTYTITGRGRVAGQINATLIQEGLAGKTLDEALAYLASAVDIQPGTTPEITLSPDFTGRLPLLPVRITIRVLAGEP